MALEDSGWRREPAGAGGAPIASPGPGLGWHVALRVLARAMASPLGDAASARTCLMRALRLSGGRYNICLIKMSASPQPAPRRRPRQLGLEFRTWGGKRAGAGRKPR